MKKNNTKRYGKFTIVSQFFSFRDIVRWVFHADIRMLKREIRYFWQRVCRGWDDSETWNLDAEISEFILPRLVRLFEITNHAPPYDIEKKRDFTDAEWLDIRNKIIYALNESRINNPDSFLHDSEKGKKVEEGLDLLNKYRYSLWY